MGKNRGCASHEMRFWSVGAKRGTKGWRGESWKCMKCGLKKTERKDEMAKLKIRKCGIPWKMWVYKNV